MPTSGIYVCSSATHIVKTHRASHMRDSLVHVDHGKKTLAVVPDSFHNPLRLLLLELDVLPLRGIEYRRAVKTDGRL